MTSSVNTPTVAETANAMENQGQSFVQGIQGKYGYREDEELTIEIYVPKIASAKPGEILVPKEICLENHAINRAGEQATIKSLCGKVTLLDLSENLFSEWSEIFQILENVPMCSFLNLRANPLTRVSQITDAKYPNLQKLVLNDVNLPWDSVVQLMNIFPKLQELQLCRNDYTTVDIPEMCTFPELKSLHFNGNQLFNCEEMSKLGKAFPNLTNLVLLQNPLQQLPLCEDIQKCFPCLKSLNVSKTTLQSWNEIEKLGYFPQLTEVRLQGLDFMKEYNEELLWHLLVAFLPSINRLNGSTIHHTDRDKGERAFIRHYMNCEEKPTRYHDLEAKHGKVEELVRVDLTLKKTADVIVKYNNKTFHTVIENKWTVFELKQCLESLLDLHPRQMRIWHEENDGYVSSLEELLCDNLYVSRYNIIDGDELLIDRKIMGQHGITNVIKQ